MVVHSVSGVQAKKVISYVLLPGIIPRVKALFSRGFGYIAFLMANVYSIVRILPPNHPYLDPANIGRFGIRHAIGEAANHIVLSRKNIDQVLIFVALLSAVVILFLQMAFLAYGLLMPTAHASGILSMFTTPAPTAQGPGMVTDVAFSLLDRVFGVPNLFCAGANNSACTLVSSMSTFPWPFHVALHKLFQFYSLGLLLVGVLIFLYFTVVVIAETAVTGSPFGQRFQNIWVPIRIVIALGLLVPVNYGLNGSQYIVLYAAKFGSGFATNTWITFNDRIAANGVFSTGSANPTGEKQTLVAKPVEPDISPVVQFMSIVQACRYAYWKSDPERNTGVPATDANLNFYPRVQPHMVKDPDSWMANKALRAPLDPGTTYEQARAFYGNGGDIIIRFGELSFNYASQTGNVLPICGDIRIKVSSIGAAGALNAADVVQRVYFDLIKKMWFGGGTDDSLRRYAQRFIELYDDSELSDTNTVPWQCVASMQDPLLPPSPTLCKTQFPSVEMRQTLINHYQAEVNAAIITAWNDYRTNTLDFAFTEPMRNLGWAGAGTWYNTIAQMNGAFMDAVISQPAPNTYPLVMEMSRKENLRENRDITNLELFTPNLQGGELASIDDLPIASRLSDFYVQWNDGGANQARMDKTPTGSTFRDMVNLLFGFRGLYNLLGENTGIHPLAQLATLGKGLVNSAILSFGSSIAANALMPLAALINLGGVGAWVHAATSIASSVALVGLTAGLILFYVLPFLPFLYFYFAVGTWIMSIFEAMVGAPLWALAHLRIEGEGLSGDAAKDGYFLIFDIFLRPVLSVFGLVAAMVIFTAQVRILNMIWLLVVANITGYDSYGASGEILGKARDVVDQFFFTILYTIIVYMMATGSFKLIDKIPDNIIRWMGSNLTTFSSVNEDPTGGLTRYAAIGGYTVGSQVTNALQQAGSQVGGNLADELKKVLNTTGKP